MRTRPTSRICSKTAAALAIAIALSGCANKYDNLTADTRAKMMDDLKAGRLVLDCGTKCALTWITKVDQINNYDTAERWPDLAQLVMQIGYGQDLAYYYLGQAAQGLGYHNAAIGYYRFALAVANGQDNSLKCEALQTTNGDGCQGVDLGSAVPVLIQASQQAMAHQPYALRRPPRRAVRRASTQPRPAAPQAPTNAAPGPSGWSLPPE